ncbi:MAG TPA: hypothetical protein VFG21_10920 [Xanthomonadaceae bacterium]|nr:hypothetical protein [Xanthomonadaceae bacterium]
MGILDELEREAEQRRQAEADAEAGRSERERIWTEQLAPRLAELGRYLEQLVATLRYLERRATVRYALPGYGEVVAEVEPQFSLRVAPGSGRFEIELEFAAQVVSEQCPQVRVTGVTRVTTLQNVFQQHRLSGLSEPRRNANGEVLEALFVARGRIPMRVHVLGERSADSVRMQFTNMEGFGESGRSFGPGQLTPELFDALGRFIARQDTAFTQEQVSDEVRARLKARIDGDQLKREWERKLSRQLHEDEARVLATMAPGARGTLLGRLRLAFRRRR